VFLRWSLVLRYTGSTSKTCVLIDARYRCQDQDNYPGPRLGRTALLPSGLEQMKEGVSLPLGLG